jgi:hypothetical protein
MTRYTEGLWIYNGVGDEENMDIRVYRPNGGYLILAGVWPLKVFLGHTIEEAHANGKLMAAAPDLLEAAELLLARLGEVGMYDFLGVAELKAAINKARSIK